MLTILQRSHYKHTIQIEKIENRVSPGRAFYDRALLCSFAVSCRKRVAFRKLFLFFFCLFEFKRFERSNYWRQKEEEEPMRAYKNV